MIKGTVRVLVFQHCYKTRWKAILRIFPLINQTCLATNQIVAGNSTTYNKTFVTRFTGPRQIRFAAIDVIPV